MGEQIALALVLGLGLASLLTWFYLLSRWVSRGQLLDYEPRIRPRWRGGEVFIVFLIFHWLLLLSGLFELLAALSGGGHWGQESSPLPVAMTPEELEKLVLHPVIVLVQSEPSTLTVLTCFLVVAILAPVSEEVVFRLVLLGYLLRKEKRWRIRAGWLRRLPRGAVSVVVISLWFAFLHARPISEPPHPSDVWVGLIVTGFFGLIAIATTMILAAGKQGGFLVNMGLEGRKWWTDFRLGAVAFLALTPPLWILQLRLVPVFARWGMVPDPVPIFVLSVGLGALYAYTGRVAPSIVLHMLHNVASFLLGVLSLLG